MLLTRSQRCYYFSGEFKCFLYWISQRCVVTVSLDGDRLALHRCCWLVRTDKRSVKHIMSSAVSFRFHYACHLILRNVVGAAPARILSAEKMVQGIVRFVCVPNRKPRTETVQYEYMYRYTPNNYSMFKSF